MPAFGTAVVAERRTALIGGASYGRSGPCFFCFWRNGTSHVYVVTELNVAACRQKSVVVSFGAVVTVYGSEPVGCVAVLLARRVMMGVELFGHTISD